MAALRKMKLLEWLDQHEFLNIRIWDFSCRSLFAAYGSAFLAQAALLHPIKFGGAKFLVNRKIAE